jgi:long-chain acyl-CoA synthetase
MPTILSHLKNRVREIPDKIFLNDGAQTWSFKDFYNDMARFSTFLLTNGIGNGDYVLIHLDRKIEHLIVYAALLNIGAISVHTYPEREDDYIEFALKHTHAKAVVSNKFAGDSNGAKILKFMPCENLEPTDNEDPNEIAYIMFTSGTTSSPKAVITTQKNVMFVTDTLIKLSGMKEQLEREIILLPLGSTGGLGHFHACLFLGNYAWLYPGLYANLNASGIDTFLNTLISEKATGVLLTPGLIGAMLKNHQEKLKQAGKTLRYALANVMPMKRETITTLLQLLPHLNFCTYYGSTEASRSIINRCRENPGFEHMSGKPAEGVAVKIVHQNDKNEGELYIKGPNVMARYLHEEESLNDGWFATGDIGSVDNNGFIQVLGRVKEIINIDGLKIFPHEIETIVSGCDKIDDCGLCTIETPSSAQELCLVVVANTRHKRNPICNTVLAMLKKHFKYDITDLYHYKIPTRLYFETRIPRTDLGKIKRNEMSNMITTHANFIVTKECT